MLPNLFQWFPENKLKENACKNVHVNTGTSQIKNSSCERLLGIDIDCKLSFENHINQTCTKARAKIKSLARTAHFQNKGKRKLFHGHTLNNKINRLHERCLRIIYNVNTSSFAELLEIDNSVSMHHRNIQVLANELYKVINGLSPKLVIVSN